MRIISKSEHRRGVLLIVAIYALSGGLWVYCSDTILGWLVQDPAIITRLAIFKGIVFIALTSSLLFVLINRFIRQREQSFDELHAIIQTTRDGFYITDTTGSILEVNDAYCTMTGYTRDELLKMGVSALEALERPEEVTAHIARIMISGSDSFESQHRCKDGRIIDIETSVTFLQNLDGRFYCFIRDITERRIMQDERIKGQKLESLGVLAGGIAHDFNNILTGIMGNISFARKFIDKSHRSSKILEQAEKASQRASDLAHQLLTFAKGGQPIKKTVSIRQIIEASASLVLHGSNVVSAITIPDSLYAIDADEGQISQAFNNIIINAAQAMPDGGTITITAENVTLDSANMMSLAAGKFIEVTFTDTGCGISAEDQKKIFDPYFTTKPSGNGLGLASVYSIISKHGGHISVRSMVGRGTTFYILLPASNRNTTDTEADTTAAEAGEHYSLLVMDDEELIRNLASDMFADLGYHVQTCSNGDEAIALYTAAKSVGVPFSAVIMDLTIPGGMGGKEAAQHILRIDPQARLIVSSGYSNDPVMADYTRFGFCATIVKPYSLTEIAQVLSGLLR
jgi:PAS domain S-box-containing protein